MNAEVPGEVIVIFGAAVEPDGRASPALERRVAAAIAHGQGRDAIYLVTGGPVAAPMTEAAAMTILLRASGIPAAQIVQEPAARNTLDSARRCRALLARMPPRVTLCSDDFHLPRCRWLFRLAGIPADVIAAHPKQRRLWPMVREAIAIPVDTVCWVLNL